DPRALKRTVADALVHPPGQHVVLRREPFAVVEHPGQRVVARADLHDLVQAHVPAGYRVDLVDHRLATPGGQPPAGDGAPPTAPFTPSASRSPSPSRLPIMWMSWMTASALPQDRSRPPAISGVMMPCS